MLDYSIVRSKLLRSIERFSNIAIVVTMYIVRCSLPAYAYSSSGFHSNVKAKATELLETIEDIFPRPKCALRIEIVLKKNVVYTKLKQTSKRIENDIYTLNITTNCKCYYYHIQ